MDDNKVCFITCVNNELYYEETLIYLHNLVLPDNMQVEYIGIRNASSAAAAYNEGMKASNAKYKIYLHQDCFLVHKDALNKIVSLFKDNPSIGMLGVAGCSKVPSTGVWWQSNQKVGRIYHADVPENLYETVYGDVPDELIDVQIIDGVFMATQYDLPWREDLFTGWHFYDVSHSFEFHRKGYSVAVLHQDGSWVIHATGEKDLDQEYDRFRKIFLAEYGSELCF